jgi:hypothetical protein
MLRKIKFNIIKRQLNKRKIDNPFDLKEGETYKLPQDAKEDQNNSYYFSGHDLDGRSLFLRLGLRGGGTSEIWFTYKDETHFLVSLDNLTSSDQSPISLKCLEVGNRWEIIFDGMVIDKLTNKKANLKFSGTFIATAPVFDFFHDLPSDPLAKAISQEKWTKSFFKEVARNNQVHYEQQGRIQGTLVIGEQTINIDLPSIRDHSYGTRTWEYMNNHMWLMALDEAGQSMNISFVSYPSIKRLLVGNIFINDEIVPFEDVEFLSNPKPMGKIPEDIRLNVRYKGQSITIIASKDAEVIYTFEDGSYTLIEGLGSFEINGRKARGIVEFGFNRDHSRWC